MPPAVAVNSANEAQIKREEALKGALKDFILKDRQRKKEEFEAKVEEERLRKEREAKERQNDMTLEETRGQINKLNEKLTELRNQKQQLFLHLKKVLNEDENRKKQQKDNEILAMHALQAQQNVPQQQHYMPVRMPHHQILPKPVGNQPVKRGRSPSPPSHQSYYKGTSYAPLKHGNPDYARVLWNKPPTQYQSPGTLFYQTNTNPPSSQAAPNDNRGPPLIFPTYNNLPIRQQAGQKPTQVYINLDQPPISQAGSVQIQSQKPQVTMEKINDRYVEIKHDGSHQIPEGVYTPLMAGMHPNVMQITGNPGQNPKTASISQGYPPNRGASTAHEQQMARHQQQILQSQPGQQQQQIQYQRRLF